MKIWKIEDYDYFLKYVLKVKESELIEYTSDEEIEKYYSKTYSISKKDGSRKIYNINKDSKLYELQKNIKNNLLDNIMLADSCCGFRKGYSYYNFLDPHKSFNNLKYYLRLDIKDFFSSIELSLIEDVLDYYFKINNNLNEEHKKKALEFSLKIMTYNKKIVQGAVTSPSLSNIIFRQLDLRIEKYCQLLDITYTRYADDLLFSSCNRKVHSKSFLDRISEIVESKKLKLNFSKTIRTKGFISLNGYVVRDGISLSRSKLKGLNRVLFYIESKDYTSERVNFKMLNFYLKKHKDKKRFNNSYSLINYLNGNRAFLISALNEYNDNYVERKKKNYISRIEKIVDAIEEINNK